MDLGKLTCLDAQQLIAGLDGAGLTFCICGRTHGAIDLIARAVDRTGSARFGLHRAAKTLSTFRQPTLRLAEHGGEIVFLPSLGIERAQIIPERISFEGQSLDALEQGARFADRLQQFRRKLQRVLL